MIFDCIPTPLNFSWQTTYLNWRLYSVNTQKINQHLDSIKRQLEPDAQLNPTIINEAFWTQLTAHFPNHPQLLSLYELWKRVASLAHLDSRALIHLLREDIFALDQCYSLVQSELNEEDKHNLLVVDLMTLSRRELTVAITQNKKKLSNLRHMIVEGLYFRALISRFTQQKRHVDDVGYYFIEQINTLQIMEEKISINAELSQTLNDDRRMFVAEQIYAAESCQFEKINVLVSKVHPNAIVLEKLATELPEACRKKVTKEQILRNKQQMEAFSKSILQQFDIHKYEDLKPPAVGSTLFAKLGVFFLG